MTTIPYGMEMAPADQQLALILPALLQALVSYIIIAVVLLLAVSVLMIVATWCIFKKAGTGGWKALIPIYCDYTLYKIAWKKKYFFMMLVFAILGGVLSSMGRYFPEYASILHGASGVLTIAVIVIDIISFVKLAKVFRKGAGFAVGLILLPVIFFPILGFGKAKYRRRKHSRKENALPQPETT